MATFLCKPYLGDINHGTADALELYNKAHDKKFNINQKNACDIQAAFTKYTSNFRWGSAISSVQIDNAMPPATRNILSQA